MHCWASVFSSNFDLLQRSSTGHPRCSLVPLPVDPLQLPCCTWKQLRSNTRTYREAKANTGKNTPRQCLKLTSSSLVGLYHNSNRRKNSLALRTRPDNSSLARPSAATLRRSLLCGGYEWNPRNCYFKGGIPLSAVYEKLRVQNLNAAQF